jgi:hypothetical protein
MSNTIVSTFGTFTDQEITKLKKSLREMSDVFSMQEAQRETLKAILDDAYDELKIPKKILRKLAKTYHKRNFSEVSIENEEFELLYTGVVDNKTQ